MEETRKKLSESVSKAYTDERKAKHAQYMKELWAQRKAAKNAQAAA